jgi:hypothetical protein
MVGLVGWSVGQSVDLVSYVSGGTERKLSSNPCVFGIAGVFHNSYIYKYS